MNDPQGNPVRRPEGLKTIHRAFPANDRDLHITVEETITEGEKNCRAMCGSRRAGGEGAALTNQPIEFTGLTIVKIEHGKIAAASNEFDFMKMHSQLRALTLNPQ